MRISKFTLIPPKIALDKLLPALETVMTPEIIATARRYADPRKRIAETVRLRKTKARSSHSRYYGFGHCPKFLVN